jgi:hypothetical protein
VVAVPADDATPAVRENDHVVGLSEVAGVRAQHLPGKDQLRPQPEFGQLARVDEPRVRDIGALRSRQTGGRRLASLG